VKKKIQNFHINIMWGVYFSYRPKIIPKRKQNSLVSTQKLRWSLRKEFVTMLKKIGFLRKPCSAFVEHNCRQNQKSRYLFFFNSSIYYQQFPNVCEIKVFMVVFLQICKDMNNVVNLLFLYITNFHYLIFNIELLPKWCELKKKNLLYFICYHQ
jgi:hypothetical protein